MSEKDYNKTLSPLFKSGKFDRYQSLVITPEIYDALQGVQIGDRIVVKLFDDDFKAERNINPKIAGYLEHMTKEQIAAAKEAYERRQSEAGEGL